MWKESPTIGTSIPIPKNINPFIPILHHIYIYILTTYLPMKPLFHMARRPNCFSQSASGDSGRFAGRRSSRPSWSPTGRGSWRRRPRTPRERRAKKGKVWKGRACGNREFVYTYVYIYIYIFKRDMLSIKLSGILWMLSNYSRMRIFQVSNYGEILPIQLWG